MNDNTFAKYSSNVSFIATCFVSFNPGKLPSIFLRAFNNVLQSFSVNCSTNILNHGLKIDAKLQIGRGIVAAHVEILRVNMYSHPEHNIWIGKNYYKGVSLYTEIINCHSFSKYGSFTGDQV